MKPDEYEKAKQWLADAPLFIDADRVERFYDAVVRPHALLGDSTVEFEELTVAKVMGELLAGVEGGTPELVKFLADIKGRVEAKVGREKEKGESKRRTQVFHSIHTPQRQLLSLADHYFEKLPGRCFYVEAPNEETWRRRETIAETPRQLVFLDLPGEREAEKGNLPTLKLIPTAAEFESGEVVPLFAELRAKNGETPPVYPERDAGDRKVEELRKEYWSWFDKNFSPTRALQLVESMAKGRGRLHWIDYRLPITNEGDTLHLHFSPEGKYATGVFAYYLIKRGFKHGLRLVGTLKSEPDMDVLAVYEK